MADDIKQDADSQRGLDAPRPRTREEGGSLSGVIDEIKKGNEEQVKTTEANIGLVANMVNIANSVERVGLAGNAAIDTLANNLSGNKLKELETANENAARDDRTNELLEELVDNTDTDLLDAPSGFFGKIVAGIGGLSGALLGLVAGFSVGVLESIKLMGSGFKNLGGRILTFIDDLFGKNISKGLNTLKGGFQSRFITPVDDFFKNINRAFKAGFRGEKIFRQVNGRFGKLGFFGTIGTKLGNAFRSVEKGVDLAKGLKATVTTFFAGIGTKFTSAFKGFSTNFGIGDDIKKATDSLKSIKASVAGFVTPFAKTTDQAKVLKNVVMAAVSPFKLFADFFRFFATKFAPLGKVLGKIFLPVTIIMGIFDGIKGAISGAAEEEGTANKFIGGITGAIKGILIGLVGMPLDLLKDLVAWIAGKLGFENASEALGNFSFSGLIGNIIDTIREFFGGVVDFVVGLFTFDGEKIRSGFGAMTDAIGNVLKPLLRSILPDPKGDLLSIGGFAARAIPSFIYDYAGIDKSTGEMKPLENSIFDTVKKDTGEELNAGSIENEDNKNQQNGVTQSALVDNSSKNATQQTINIMGNMNLATESELRFQR